MEDQPTILNIPDDILAEQVRLIHRGVRPMAMLESFQSDPVLMLRVATRLETLSEGRVVPFVIDCGDGKAECGFAASRWIVETFQWIQKNAQEPYYSRLTGLLLGYSASAIHDFEQKQSIRCFTVSLEPETN